jgi:hypothetical protein
MLGSGRRNGCSRFSRRRCWSGSFRLILLRHDFRLRFFSRFLLFNNFSFSHGSRFFFNRLLRTLLLLLLSFPLRPSPMRHRPLPSSSSPSSSSLHFQISSLSASFLRLRLSPSLRPSPSLLLLPSSSLLSF